MHFQENSNGTGDNTEHDSIIIQDSIKTNKQKANKPCCTAVTRVMKHEGNLCQLFIRLVINTLTTLNFIEPHA